MSVSQPGDDVLVVVFRDHANPNELLSQKEGRPIYESIDVCVINSPGSRNNTVQPATAVSHWSFDQMTGSQKKITYAERFARQYQQFKASQSQTMRGTPLDYAKFLTEAQRATLRALNVYTLEALATLDGQELKNIGPGGRELKNAAMEYIESSKQNVPTLQLEAELKALRAKNEALEQDLAAKSKAEGEFGDMSDDQLRDYIKDRTGHAPSGALARKSLLRMANEATKKEVA